MNKLTCYGRVSSDVTLNDMNGRQVANFNIAANTKRKDKETGKYIANFYRVSVWGLSAASASTYLKKGNRVTVSGDFVARPYVGSDGTQKMSLEIDNADFELVETRAENEARGQAAGAAAPAPAGNFTPVETGDDDLPF